MKKRSSSAGSHIGKPTQKGATRRGVIHGAAAAGVIAGVPLAAKHAFGMGNKPAIQKKPNILFVLPDQHRHDAIGAAGNSMITTPTMDRLVKEGTLFSKCWAQSPVCRPARASLITGRYPHQHGIATNSMPPFDAGWPTMMKNLQAVGYETASFGKTHYDASDEEAGGAEAPPREMNKDVRKTYPYLRSLGLDHVMEEGGQWYPAMKGFSSSYTDYLRENGLLEAYRKSVLNVWTDTGDQWEPFITPYGQEHDVTSFVARATVDWLDKRDKSKPFFAYYAPIKPHVPLAADPVWAAYYENRPVPQGPRNKAEEVNPVWAAYIKRRYGNSHPEKLTPQAIDRAKRIYYAMISLVDQNVGNILSALERQGELDNTWVLWSSDHGEMMGDHLLMGKSVFYHAAVGVPGIIRPPKNTPKVQRVDAPVEVVDLTSTILDIAGAPPLAQAQGHSLLPVMNGASVKNPVAFSEISNLKGDPYFVAVSDGHYRYTVDQKTRTPCELFDLKNDPDEVDNLVNDKGYEKLGLQMQGDFIEPHMKKA